MSLMQSAIDAIDMGVEDFQSADNRRMASAVRNFYAGVLLLLKEKLRRESPPGSNEVLLYEKLRFQKSPTGIKFIGTGNKTVDKHKIIERFKELGLKLDVKRLNRLAEIRNDFEHYVSKKSPQEVQAAMAATFLLVFSILEDHLECKPSTIFKPETWKVIRDEAETYKEIADRCRKSIEEITETPTEVLDALKRIKCPSCDSDLLQADHGTYFGCEFTCSACGEQTELSEVIEEALASAYEGIAYRRAKDGDDDPLGSCPHCGLETFSIDADLCLACGEGRAYRDCLRCGASLSLYEQNNGLCGYCNHVMDKDD